MNVGAILLLGASLMVAAHTAFGRGRSSGAAVRVESSIGRHLDSLVVADISARWKTIQLGNTTTIIYAFLTTCPACAHQKSHVASLLAPLPREQVITLSTESGELLQGYWGGLLAPPLQVHPATLEELGLKGVPSLLIIDEGGVVREAWMGLVTDWKAVDLQRLVRKATRE